MISDVLRNLSRTVAKSLSCENPLYPVKRIKAIRESIKIVTRCMIGVGLKWGSHVYC